MIGSALNRSRTAFGARRRLLAHMDCFQIAIRDLGVSVNAAPFRGDLSVDLPHLSNRRFSLRWLFDKADCFRGPSFQIKPVFSIRLNLDGCVNECQHILLVQSEKPLQLCERTRQGVLSLTESKTARHD